MPHAFSKHSDAQVRAVLQYLCKDKKIAAEATKAFEILAAHEKSQSKAHAVLSPVSRRAEGDHDRVEAHSSDGSSLKKRKITNEDQETNGEPEEGPMVEICIYCSSPFTAKSNHKRACRSHDGELHLDYDTSLWGELYSEHDPRENIYALANTEANRREFPGGFVWSCCDRKGSKRGCKLRAHISHEEPPQLKRWAKWFKSGYGEQRATEEAHIHNGVRRLDMGREVAGYMKYRRLKIAAKGEQKLPRKVAVKPTGGGGRNDAIEIADDEDDDEGEDEDDLEDDDSESSESEISIGHSDDDADTDDEDERDYF